MRGTNPKRKNARRKAMSYSKLRELVDSNAYEQAVDVPTNETKRGGMSIIFLDQHQQA